MKTKMLFMKFYLGAAFLFFSHLSESQLPAKIDSLLVALDDQTNDSLRAYTLDELSYEWFVTDLDSSLIYGKLAYQLFENLDDSKGLSQAASSVAIAYHYLNAWDSAEYYYQRALKIRRFSADTLKTASSLNNLGVMYMDKEDYNQATNHFLEAMKVRESLNSVRGVAITNSNLGLIFKKQGIFDKAISYYKAAEKDIRELDMEPQLEVVLLNLSSIYNTSGQFEKGLAHGLELSRLAGKRMSKRNLAKSYVNISNSYQGLKSLDSAVHYVTQAMAFFEEQKDTLNMARSLLSMSQFFYDIEEYDKSIIHASRLQQLNKALDNRELLIDGQVILSLAYAKKKNYKDAYESLQTSFDQKDSLLNQALNSTIVDLTLKYETEQKEREISELKIENQQSEIDRQKSNNQRNIFILVAIGLIITSILLFILVRTKTKSNVLITNSLQEKEVLLKEIHHRVKNNLQIISSLLSLQSRFIEDEKAQAAVNEGQNRVKSMALIHQKLYQKDSLSGVEVFDYIKNLTSTLKSTYAVDADLITVHFDVDKLYIDVDTIIPLGLIINELMSNVFKHAFPDEREGQVWIKLKEAEGKLKVSVRDNGVGKTTDLSLSDSFGMRMINSLSRKLEAEVAFDFADGTDVSLLISNYKLV